MSAVKHQPATPLPWTWIPADSYPVTLLVGPNYDKKRRGSSVLEIYESHGGGEIPKEQDAAYLTHAAQAYPELVAYLLDLESHLKRGAPLREGLELRARQQALLAKLGEGS